MIIQYKIVRKIGELITLSLEELAALHEIIGAELEKVKA